MVTRVKEGVGFLGGDENALEQDRCGCTTLPMQLNVTGLFTVECLCEFHFD